jgi:hypothetical protein
MLNPSTVEKLKEIVRRSTISYEQAKSKLGILRDVCALSSGTLATLTKKRAYEDLDMIHNDFVTFTNIMLPRKNWETWMDAWNAFECCRAG